LDYSDLSAAVKSVLAQKPARRGLQSQTSKNAQPLLTPPARQIKAALNRRAKKDDANLWFRVESLEASILPGTLLKRYAWYRRRKNRRDPDIVAEPHLLPRTHRVVAVYTWRKRRPELVDPLGQPADERTVIDVAARQLQSNSS